MKNLIKLSFCLGIIYLVIKSISNNIVDDNFDEDDVEYIDNEYIIFDDEEI